MRAQPTQGRARASSSPQPPPQHIPAPPDPSVGRKGVFLAELQKTLGVIELACSTTGIDRAEFDGWLATDPDFVKRVKRIEVIAYDFAKAKLMELVDKRSPGAVIHLLKSLDAQNSKDSEEHISVFSFDETDDDGAPMLPEFTGAPDTVKHKTRYLQCLERCDGIVTKAARAAKVAPKTVTRWRDADEAFRRAEAGINEVCLDMVEGELMKQIKAGETAPTIFYLKTKGKHRGFIERTELSGPNGGPVSTLHMTLEDAKQDLPKDALLGIYKSLMVADGKVNGTLSDAASFFAQGRNGATPKRK